MGSRLYSVADARAAAFRRLPRIMFDFIDGAAGGEYAKQLSSESLERVRLQPRTMVDVRSRVLTKSFLGRTMGLPFGIAPMGMCDLAWPGADKMLCAAARRHGVPLCLSTAASSSIEDTRDRAGDNAWFQLYVGQSHESAFAMVDRAEAAGYDTLILTVDSPVIFITGSSTLKR